MSGASTPNLSDRVLKLEGQVSQILDAVHSFSSKLETANLNQKGDRRYVWGVVAGLLFPAIGLLSGVFGLYVANHMGPVKADVVGVQSGITGLLRVQDSNFSRIGRLEQELAAEIATRRAQLIEVETQVDSLSQSTNMQIAELHRWNYQASQKIPEMPVYPNAPFLQPNISNRAKPTQQ